MDGIGSEDELKDQESKELKDQEFKDEWMDWECIDYA